MKHVVCIYADQCDPVSLHRNACPRRGTTAGLAAIEQQDATTAT